MNEKALGGDELAQPLLTFLRGVLKAPSLEFEEAPTLVGRGVQARIYALSLSDSHNKTEWGSVPLVCRVPSKWLQEHDRLTPVTADIQTVAAFQEAVADLGYPAPRVVAAGTHRDGLGVPFIVMERMRGRSAAVYLLSIIMLWLGLTLLWRHFFFAVLAPPIPALAGSIGILVVLGYCARSLARLHRLPVTVFAELLTKQGISSGDLETGAALDLMHEQIERSGAEELAPGLMWLRAHLPSMGERKVICHLDHHAGNVMLNHRGVSGVIDWDVVAVAGPELDIAWNRTISIVVWYYVSFAGEPLRSLVGFVLTFLIWVFNRLQELLYRIFANLASEKIRYYTAYCSLLGLLADADGLLGDMEDSGRGRRILRRRFRRATGLSLMDNKRRPLSGNREDGARQSFGLLVLLCLSGMVLLFSLFMFLDLMFRDTIIWLVESLPVLL